MGGDGSCYDWRTCHISYKLQNDYYRDDPDLVARGPVGHTSPLAATVPAGGMDLGTRARRHRRSAVVARDA